MVIKDELRNEVLARYSNWYENGKSDIEKLAYEQEKNRKEFVNRYTNDAINSMRVDDYIVGKESKESFCYYVETKLDELGEIHGATSSKFGVYFSKDDGKYMITSRFGEDEEEALSKIKPAIIELKGSSILNQSNIIENNILSPMFKYKINYLYHPDESIPIYAEDDIDAILTYFDLPNGKSVSRIDKRNLLFKFYKELNIPNSTPLLFQKFLYNADGYRFVLRSEEVKEYKDAKVNRQSIKHATITEVNDISDIFKVNTSRESKRIYSVNIERELEKKYTGTKGEQKAIEYFDTHIKELNIKKIWYYCDKSKPYADDTVGYDIKYIDNDGIAWFVEVKATKSNVSGEATFLMSRNELNAMKANLDHYYILYFNNVYRNDNAIKIPASAIIEKKHAVKFEFKLKID